MSRHPNTGQSHSLLITNKSFEVEHNSSIWEQLYK